MRVYKVVTHKHYSALVSDPAWRRHYPVGEWAEARLGTWLMAFKTKEQAQKFIVGAPRGVHIHEADARVTRRKLTVLLGWRNTRWFWSFWATARKLRGAPLRKRCLWLFLPRFCRGVPCGTVFCEAIKLGNAI